MSDPAQSSSGDAIQAQLAKLRKKYGLGLPEKVAAIEAGVAAIDGAWNETACSAAYRQIHSLAGSSGTYGFPEITSVARAAESILKASLESRAILSAADRGRIDGYLARLREMAADAARQVSG